MKKHISGSLLFILLLYIIISCKQKTDNSSILSDGNYPPEVGSILISKCTSAGCHNATSHARDLVLDSWEHLFEGDGQGAVVIPYSTKYSVLLSTINTDTTLGAVIRPFHPSELPGNYQTLSKEECSILYKWVLRGAPDKIGNIAFASDADTRQKLYMTEQGSDLVSVIDAKSMLVMRCIPIGVEPTMIESPHNIAASADGKNVYVSFYAGSYIQKIDTRSDTVIESIDIGHYASDNVGSWNVVYPSPGADTALITSNLFLGNGDAGSLAFLKSNPLKKEAGFAHFINGIEFIHPHGITSNFSFDTFFIASEYGNTIYKFYPSGLQRGDPYIKYLSIDGGPPEQDDGLSGKPDPHALLMAPDYSRYFVTCEATNEVRVMDAHNDSLLKVLPVGTFPQEAALSKRAETPYLFITCRQDGNNPNPFTLGSVYVFDYNTYELKTIIYGPFYQPHGICVDDRYGRVYIPSSNLNGTSHHCNSAICLPGWYNVYDLNTLKPVNNISYDVPLTPYSICTRFSQ